MDKDETQVEQSGCGCDSSSGDDTCCSPGGGKSNWRTALFVMVVVLAGGVAAHSVLTNGDKDSSCGTGPVCGMEQANDADVKAAGCPTGTTNGDGEKTCPSERKTCPKTGTAGKAAGCSPSQALADPAPQPAPTAPAGGCCPGH